MNSSSKESKHPKSNIWVRVKTKIGWIQYGANSDQMKDAILSLVGLGACSVTVRSNLFSEAVRS